MAINLDFRFLGLYTKAIDIESIVEFINDDGVKRINFEYVQKNSLKPFEGDIAGWLNLPFDDPFEAIAKKELEMDRVLFKSKSGTGYYRRVGTQEEFDKLKSFIDKYKSLVFLRDCLDLSVALSMHEFYPDGADEPARTEMGQHEYRLKYNSETCDTSADRSALIAELQKRLEQLPYFKLADYICAVPSSRPIMRDIISGLKGFSFSDMSDKVSWKDKSGSLKELKTAEEKLSLIDTWGLIIDEGVDLKGKSVLLVDDMYQSGVTMQYVAMKLKDAGSKRVFGLALCKALSNN